MTETYLEKLLRNQLGRQQLRLEHVERCYQLMYSIITVEQRQEFLRLGKAIDITSAYCPLWDRLIQQINELEKELLELKNGCLYFRDPRQLDFFRLLKNTLRRLKIPFGYKPKGTKAIAKVLKVDQPFTYKKGNKNG